jgi:hypothetical protein
MPVVAGQPIRAHPIPVILLFLNRLDKIFAYNLGGFLLVIALALFLDELDKLALIEIDILLAIHDELGALVYMEVHILALDHAQIVGVFAILAFVAEALLVEGADPGLWVDVLVV